MFFSFLCNFETIEPRINEISLDSCNKYIILFLSAMSSSAIIFSQYKLSLDSLNAIRNLWINSLSDDDCAYS